ncbi:DUF4190 domain-containing protein [Microbacterium lacticum]|uniref:DUF4190 domain-containing protein n=1 Tax=Microbacterium lacticum TaxID=33885 RepID=UPI0028D73911|nr:DUF4190 domain-containing protein [Microbacterium lacticum]
MTDPTGPQSEQPAQPAHPETASDTAAAQQGDPTPYGDPAAYPTAPLTPPPPAYDAASYVAPAAPAYDTTPYPPVAPSSEVPAYAPPTYAPPAYVAPPAYGAAPAYGATPEGAYGGYPVQTTPGAPPVAPYGYGAYPTRKTNGVAVASLVLSIVGFLWILPLVGSVAGAIMGHIALGQIKRTGEGGGGMALAGVIIGWAGVALLLLGVLFLFFVVAVSSGSSQYS